MEESMANPDLHFAGIAITTVGVIVRDVEASVREYSKAFGWGPWKFFTHEPWESTYRGRPASYTIREAYTRPAGQIGFALVQPGLGDSMWADLLASRGEGLQFLSLFQPSEEAAKELIRKTDRDVIMTGRVGDRLRFYFLDTLPTLHLVVETGYGDTSTLNVDQIVGDN
jgi:methylmalonyl-CoA/ethylmalonyl-CoA epimerase